MSAPDFSFLTIETKTGYYYIFPRERWSLLTARVPFTDNVGNDRLCAKMKDFTGAEDETKEWLYDDDDDEEKPPHLHFMSMTLNDYYICFLHSNLLTVYDEHTEFSLRDWASFYLSCWWWCLKETWTADQLKTFLSLNVDHRRSWWSRIVDYDAGDQEECLSPLTSKNHECSLHFTITGRILWKRKSWMNSENRGRRKRHIKRMERQDNVFCNRI